mmetsp:Transcript_69960/g.221678  ORF Transcript_69960/g.221678 Transcript_69960/m.221678 type:complete len:213 (+) Transcript_69960:76-714(+)
MASAHESAGPSSHASPRDKGKAPADGRDIARLLRSPLTPAPAPEADTSELHFLVLHLLQGGPCKRSATALLEEANDLNLLPRRTDFNGKEHTLSYEEMVGRYPGIPHDHIGRMLRKLVSSDRAKAARGITTLISPPPPAPPGGGALVPSTAYPCEYTTLPLKLRAREAGISVRTLRPPLIAIDTPGCLAVLRPASCLPPSFPKLCLAHSSIA